MLSLSIRFENAIYTLIEVTQKNQYRGNCLLVIMTKITMVFRNTKWEEIGISEYLIYKFYKDPNINNTYKDSLCLCDALIFGDFSMLWS